MRGLGEGRTRALLRRAHKLNGRRIPDAGCPAVLGRATGLDGHANSDVKASSGALTPAEAKRLLFKSAGALNAMGLELFLREAPLGKTTR